LPNHGICPAFRSVTCTMVEMSDWTISNLEKKKTTKLTSHLLKEPESLDSLSIIRHFTEASYDWIVT
jgi:hypothetical protein